MSPAGTSKKGKRQGLKILHYRNVFLLISFLAIFTFTLFLPQVTLADPRITMICGGDRHSLALDDQGQVWAWGNGSYGQIGDNLTGGSSVPKKVTALTTQIVQITSGYEHSMALDDQGNVWVWGNNDRGQVGLRRIKYHEIN